LRQPTSRMSGCGTSLGAPRRLSTTPEIATAPSAEAMALGWPASLSY
jgi:hypothetical protein